MNYFQYPYSFDLKLYLYINENSYIFCEVVIIIYYILSNLVSIILQVKLNSIHIYSVNIKYSVYH